jgi:hypothetical protein
LPLRLRQKLAVRKIIGAQRELTGRFHALVSHYLFEPDFTRVEGATRAKWKTAAARQSGCSISHRFRAM